MNSEIRSLKPSFSTDNILALDAPTSYKGRIFQYKQGHSILTVVLHSKLDTGYSPIYITFDPAYYLDLLVLWDGGNVKTAPKVDTVRLIHELGVLGDNQEHNLSMLLEFKDLGFRLFLLETPIRIFKILALGKIHVSDVAPRF